MVAAVGRRGSRARRLTSNLAALLVPAVASAARPAPPAVRDAAHIVAPRALLAALNATRRIPSFARQTRLACSACHYQFPQLTPFGRLFKLNGYTLTGLTSIPSAGDTSQRPTLALAPIPPASAMLIIGATRVSERLPGTQHAGAAFPQEASLFLAGAVTPRVGAFTQFTYAGADGSIAIDNVDLRFATHAGVGAHDVLLGLTLHNNPTVQDVWNTTPAWGYPFTSSESAPGPIASPLSEGALGQQVIGLGAYALWASTLYTELTAYGSAQQGPDANSADVARNLAPYWRVALQHQFEHDYVMIGTYGLRTTLYGEGVGGLTNRYTDVAADAQLEHRLAAPGGVVILRGSFTHETQKLDALLDAGGATSADNRLNVVRISASLLPSELYGLHAAFFTITGRADPLLYPADAIAGSGSGRPNSTGVVGELVVNPWQNTRVAAQYTLFTKFNGASRNYDAAGRNARDNDTLFLYTWVAF